MRKALIVGVDYYVHLSRLHGCVNDAHSLKAILERHSDATVNFDPKILCATGEDSQVTRADLKQAVADLFRDKGEIALLYFAGHGHVEETGGYLVTSEAAAGDQGLPLNEIVTLANKSPAANRVIILDSCHSGVAGNLDANPSMATIGEGMTILTAAGANQYAYENEAGTGGVFTTLLIDALGGAASNLVGGVTPGSVYAHIDQALGPWDDQRPLFKTNVTSFVSLRNTQPPIPLADLHQIPVLFPEPGYELPLDPSFEPDSPNPDATNVAVFTVLRRCNRVNLVVPVGAEHMYYAAMESKACKLTVLGEHYRRLVLKKRI